MTDYAIRINIQNPEHHSTIREYLINLQPEAYLIGNIEIGQETKKQHIHIYLKIKGKKETIVKQMKRLNLIQTGNESYSWIQVKKKEHHKSYQEALLSYQTYCIKTIKDKKLSYNKDYQTSYNLEYIQKLPIWQWQLKKYKSLKEEIYKTYQKIPVRTLKQAQIHILEHIMLLFRIKEISFSTQMLRAYTNGLVVKHYANYINIEEIYHQLAPSVGALF